MNKIERQQSAKAPGAQSRFSLPTVLKLIFLGVSVLLLVLIVNDNLSVPFVAGGSSLFRFFPIRPQPAQTAQTSSAYPDEQPGVNDNCRLPTARYDIYTNKAACYPSSGGIWMVELDALELRHLNINRFESTERSTNQDEEDDFCHKLRQFGGSWYNSRSADDLWSPGEEKCLDLYVQEPVFEINRQIGFPETGRGIWVLQPVEEGDPEGMYFPPQVYYPSGMATVRNALSVDERCTALKKLGAVFCDEKNIADCPGLDDLAKEPFELAEKYGRRDHGFCGTQ